VWIETERNRAVVMRDRPRLCFPKPCTFPDSTNKFGLALNLVKFR